MPTVEGEMGIAGDGCRGAVRISGSYPLWGGLTRRFLNKARTRSDAHFKGKQKYKLLLQEEEDIRSSSG